MASINSWWMNSETPRIGFTNFAAVHLRAPVLLDDVSTAEVQAYQRRCDVLATIIGVKLATANAAVRRAVVVKKRCAHS